MRFTATELAARVTGLGGSEALAYCGKDPRCSPLQLYLRKIGEAGDAPAEDARQAWGHRLEPVVRDWLAEELGTPIQVPTRTLHSTLYPYMFGNLDGVAKNEVVEIKTGDKFTSAEFGEIETDAVPIRYVLQVTHYMIVTGFRRAHIGALLGGNDARHYIVDYDQELAEQLILRAQAFWEHVVSRMPPEVQTLHDADKRWPRGSESAVQANEAMVLALEELKRIRNEEKALGATADATELLVKTFMGEATALVDARGRKLAGWTNATRESIDAKALAADHPDLASQYKRVSQYRVFRVR